MEGLKFQPNDKEESLAEEIADALDDREGLSYYVAMTRLYSADQLRRLLRHVLEVPSDRIRTKRGALFNWMVSRYGNAQDKEGK